MIDLASAKHVAASARDLAEWFIVAVVFKFIILKWVAEKTKALFMKLFVRTEHDMAIWLHYRNRAMNKGHQHPLEKCDDGRCEFD
jgi:hypothetical protein